jgi:hypothetical protein
LIKASYNAIVFIEQAILYDRACPLGNQNNLGPHRLQVGRDIGRAPWPVDYVPVV